ncbi:hypothetical protein CTA1_8272 [Colletotrichum tanaceti]|uniref:Uncharacterized protein n=1 Tax=Colletotrichum tanaceti TaxID=1306861 RepID=A0A4U6XKB4_9PEZI|nr:hypothetical protein CTA1_8272 [Colletotrichum tanaceti]
MSVPRSRSRLPNICIDFRRDASQTTHRIRLPAIPKKRTALPGPRGHQPTDVPWSSLFALLVPHLPLQSAAVCGLHALPQRHACTG